MPRKQLIATMSIALAAALPSQAQTTPPEQIETITVIGVSPLPGTGIDIDKIPGNTETLSAHDLAREGAPSVIQALTNQLGSVNINDDLDDPFQPDILYRGFEASPVLGTPEGLAVYQNGVRINEAFGDSVNWDLFPDIAIERLDVVSSNPVYGLNALGGAVIVNMKNGFNAPGGDLELSGGSFGRRSASIEYGINNGTFGAYIAGRVLDEDGWRQFSPNSLRQLYADFSARTDRLSLDLSFTGANNRLFGESPTPVQELAISRSLVFTVPQHNFDQLEFVTLNGTYAATDTLSLEGDFYYREYRQTVVNGNTTDFTACTDDPFVGSTCQGDGLTPLTNAAGALLPDISNGGAVPIGENDYEAIRTVTLGGSLQATSTAALFGHENHLSIGATFDHSSTDFQSSAELGTIDSALQISHSGLFVSTPENTPFSATPVNLGAVNVYYGLYATDTFNITPELAVTASGRYNVALIDLSDRLGSNLSGQSRYSRFNPAMGFTYKVLPDVTAYAGYAESSRAPTPGEIECSSPTSPCLLPSSLSSDPPTLHQVVSHTYEAGLRGTLRLSPDERLSWNAGLFRTDVSDDIFGIATSLSSGYFQNIGGTRRQGAEAGLRYRSDRLTIFANYSLVDATFQSALTLSSPSNPFADANGDINVHPGNRLPGIPEHRLKVGADYRLLDRWSVGGTLTFASDQYYRGDEANLLAPLPSYYSLNLHTTFDITGSVRLFASIDNVTDARYSTFGILGDPTGVGAPGIPADGVDTRFQSPAAPLSVYGGVKVKF